MLSINTSAAQGYTQNHNILSAVVSFSFNTSSKVLTITDGTSYPAGDERKALNVTVYDRFGGTKAKRLGNVGTDSAHPVNSLTIDLDADDAEGKPLNLTDGVEVTATLVTEQGKTKDGSVQDVATLNLSGSVIMQK